MGIFWLGDLRKIGFTNCSCQNKKVSSPFMSSLMFKHWSNTIGYPSYSTQAANNWHKSAKIGRCLRISWTLQGPKPLFWMYYLFQWAYKHLADIVFNRCDTLKRLVCCKTPISRRKSALVRNRNCIMSSFGSVPCLATPIVKYCMMSSYHCTQDFCTMSSYTSKRFALYILFYWSPMNI